VLAVALGSRARTYAHFRLVFCALAALPLEGRNTFIDRRSSQHLTRTFLTAALSLKELLALKETSRALRDDPAATSMRTATRANGTGMRADRVRAQDGPL